MNKEMTELKKKYFELVGVAVPRRRLNRDRLKVLFPTETQRAEGEAERERSRPGRVLTSGAGADHGEHLQVEIHRWRLQRLRSERTLSADERLNETFYTVFLITRTYLFFYTFILRHERSKALLNLNGGSKSVRRGWGWGWGKEVEWRRGAFLSLPFDHHLANQG